MKIALQGLEVGPMTVVVNRSDIAQAKPEPDLFLACVSKLKQIRLGFAIWAEDHNANKKYPISLSTNSGGSLEYANTGEVYRHFQGISNELTGPKLLICPADSDGELPKTLARGLAT